MQLQYRKVDAIQVASKKIITSFWICSFIESKCDAKKKTRNTHFRKCFDVLRTQKVMKFDFKRKKKQTEQNSTVFDLKKKQTLQRKRQANGFACGQSSCENESLGFPLH